MSEDRARLSSLKNKSYIREIELKWSLTFEMKISAVVDNILIVQYVSRVGIQDRFKQTDQALEDVPTWPNVSICHFHIFTIFTVPAYRLQIDQSVTAQKIQPIGTIGADGAEAFKSKLKFQIQHEVFRCCNISYRSQTYSQTFHPAE